jgi:hypothetical protein
LILDPATSAFCLYRLSLVFRNAQIWQPAVPVKVSAASASFLAMGFLAFAVYAASVKNVLCHDFVE